MAQLIVAAAGAAIGFAVGGPTGARIGWAIGSAVGAGLNPPEVKGPRLEDLRVGSSQYGQPIPWVAGSPRVAGQIVWASEKRETATTSEAGKGGGVEYTTYTYDCDVLYLLSDNEIAGVSRIWLNGDLIWSALVDADGETLQASENTDAWEDIRIYTGSVTQDPDPDYEAAVGTANAPAYRGRGTVFIKGLQLGNSGQLPNLTFEIATGTEPIDSAVRLLTQFNDGTSRDLSQYAIGSGTQQNPPDEDNVEFINGDLRVTINNTVISGANRQGIYWNDATLARTTAMTVEFKFKITSYTVGLGQWSIATVAEVNGFTGANTSCSVVYSPLGSVGQRFSFGVGTSPFQRIYQPTDIVIGAEYHVALVWPTSGNDCDIYMARMEDGTGVKLGTVTGWLGAGYIALGGFNTNTSEPSGGIVVEYTGVRVARTAYYSGSTYTPPVTLGDPFGIYTTDPVPLRDVVDSLLDRCGLDAAEYDTADLASVTKQVRAYAISQIAPTRTSLEILQSAFFFECSLRDKLYFRPRAQASVATIDWDELGAGQETADEQPLVLNVSSDLELPPQVAVAYANANDDWQPGVEYSDRVLSGQAATQAVQIPLGMTPAEAKGVADAIVVDNLASLTTTSLALPIDYTRLEAGDVVTAVDEDSSSYRLRLVRKRDERGILSFEAVFDDASALDSQETTDETQAPSTVVTRPSDTLIEPLDIPILRDTDDDAGFYVAAKGNGTSWPGAQIQSSIDDVTFSGVAEINESAVFGTCTTTLGNFTGVGFDEVNSVTVSIANGTLDSSTRTAMLADQTINAMLIGSEVIRFRTATLSSTGIYVLTGLLRGQRGTEWAISGHTSNERCVLLRTRGLRRVTTQVGEIGQVRYLRGVTLGKSASGVTSESFTDTGVALKPFAPVDLRASRSSSDALVLTWKRRTRLTQRFAGSGGISTPLDDTSESYDVEIYDATYTTLKRTIYGVTSATATYTAAQQVADFGSLQTTVYAKVYQVSSSVGRGYALTASATAATTGAAGSALAPVLLGASASGWIAATQRAENSGAPGIEGDLTVTSFWLSADADGPYTVEQEVTTDTADLDAPLVSMVIGRSAQVSGDLVAFQFIGSQVTWIRVPLDLATAPARITPSITFVSPRAIVTDGSRVLLFGEGSKVYESSDGETWTLVGAMAGDTFPSTVGDLTFTGQAVTKIGSRFFLAFTAVGGTGAVTDRLFYSDDTDAQTGWTKVTGLTLTTNQSLHRQVVYDGTKHYCAVTSLAAGESYVYASSDGGASWTLEETFTADTGFEESTSGTTAPDVFFLQVTGTTGSDYVRVYCANGVVYEKLVGTTSWSAKASDLVNPLFAVEYAGDVAATDQAEVYSTGGTQVRAEVAGVFSLVSGF